MNIRSALLKIPYKNRLFISAFALFFLFMTTYLGLAFGIFSLIFFKSTNLILIYFLSAYCFLIIYFLTAPRMFENVQYDLRRLSIALINEPFEKGRLFQVLLTHLNNLYKRDRGYNRIVSKSIRDYFSYILNYLIFSKNVSTLNIIQRGLLQLSESQDVHELHRNFLWLNARLIKQKDFKDLYVAYPALSRVNLNNPFLWLPELSGSMKQNNKNKIEKFFYYLKDNGILDRIVTIVLTLIILAIFGVILKKLDLIDFVKGML